MVKILTEFINPEAHYLPTQALELTISPMIIVLATPSRRSMNGFTVHLDIEPLRTQNSQVEKAAGNWILRDCFNASTSKGIGKDFLPR